MGASGLPIDIAALSAGYVEWVVEALLFGTVVAGLTWLLMRPLRGRMSPTFETALWTIVLIKFIVPIGPASSFSLASAWEKLTPFAATTTAALTETEVGFAVQPGQPSDQPAQAAPVARPRDWVSLVALGHVLVAIGLGVRRARSYRAFRARCLALPAPPEHAFERVCEVCRRLGIRRVPLVRVSDEAHSSFVMGILRPILVLSRRHLVRPDELETVVVHEVTHLRRGDMIVRCLQSVAGTLLFFWPIVAWVNRRIDRAREYVCDEWALRHGRLTASEYAWCLLQAVQPLRVQRFAYQPARMAGSPSTIERRIDVILTLPRGRRRRPILGLFAIAIVMGWGCFTLLGAVGPKKGAGVKKGEYLATKEDMQRHADAVYAQINEYAVADQDGDGKVCKEECWRFVAAAALRKPDAVLAAYPLADEDGDGKLGVVEAYRYFRGDYDLQRLYDKSGDSFKKAEQAGDKKLLKQLKADMFAAEMDAYHMFLDRRIELVQQVTGAPSAAEVVAIGDAIDAFEAEQAAKGWHKKLAGVVGEIRDLKKKAEELRAEAAGLDGEHAAKYEAKADKLEGKAAQLKAEVTGKLTGKIEQLEAAGEHEQAADLKAVLQDLLDA